MQSIESQLKDRHERVIKLIGQVDRLKAKEDWLRVMLRWAVRLAVEWREFALADESSEIEQLRGNLGACVGAVDDLCAEMKRLRAENAALREAGRGLLEWATHSEEADPIGALVDWRKVDPQ